MEVVAVRPLNDLEQCVVTHATSLGLSVTVPPTLRPGCKVLLVGEAGGEEEEREGEGFVGKAGDLLWKMMGAAGWRREDVSLTNVVKKRPQSAFTDVFYETVDLDVPQPPRSPGKAISARKIAKRAEECGWSLQDAERDLLNAWRAAHPPKPKTKRVTRETDELGRWHEVLRCEIRELAPQTIVAVGEQALHALTDVQGITHWQGSRLWFRFSDETQADVIPILHPAGILRGQQWQDVYLTSRILQRVRKGDWPTFPEPMLLTDPTLDEALRFIGMCWLADRWCIDVETRGSHVVCFSIAVCRKSEFGGEEWTAMCIPTARTDAVNARWSWEENKRVWAAVAELYAHNPRVVNHALCAFDSEWLDFYGVRITEHEQDTLHSFHLLYPELPKALDDCIRFYGLGNYHKGMVNHTARSLKNETLWEYNNLDSLRTLQLSYAIDADLGRRGLTDRYRRERTAVAVLGLGVQRTGYHLDERAEAELKAIVQQAGVEAQARLDEQYAADMSRLSHGADLVAGGVALPTVVADPASQLNVNSPQQVQSYLYDTLKLPKQYKRADSKGKRALTADDETLEKLVIQFPQHQSLKRIQNIRHFRKVEGSYLSMTRVNGWATSTVNVAGTESFRWSMGVSARGFGVNAQTFPTVTRVMIVSPPGRVFVSPDLSQVEARYVAHFAGCRSQILMFNDPTRSFHLENAHRIFGREVSKKEPSYVDAKRVGHGGNYKLGPARLSLMLGKPMGTARALLAQYHRQYPEISRWHDAVR